MRLLEMGIEAYQITSSVSAVLNQRLVRRLCLHCRRQEKGGDLYAPGGCEHCLGTGFKGRTLLAELVQLDAPLRKAILDKADLDHMELVLAQTGHQNLRENARRLVADGMTTALELEKACGPAR